MAFMTVPKVRIRGISACVPKEIHENIDYKGFLNTRKQLI